MFCYRHLKPTVRMSKTNICQILQNNRLCSRNKQKQLKFKDVRKDTVIT